MSNFIKDSANNYTLYVNQGTDFEISVDINTLNLLPNQPEDILSINNIDTLVIDASLNTLALEDNNPSVENTEYFTNLELFSSASEHITSKKKFDIEVIKDISGSKLMLRLSSDTTTSMNKPRYGFDVVSRDENNKIKRIFGGVIIMTSPYTLV